MRQALATFWESYHGAIGEVSYFWLACMFCVVVFVYAVRPWEALDKIGI